MNYPWMTHAWHAQAEAAERSARPFLYQRRWTEKDAIVSMASPPLMFGWGATIGWPEIPKGVGADFEGERALRVFLEITDGPEQRPLAPEAILFARLSGADADRARLTKDDEFLVVPLKFWAWVTGALGFDKKVLLSLPSKIARHGFDHEDAEIGPEIVWITPMKTGDRRYYYAVLPLVGMGGVIDTQKGNPSFFTGITTLKGINFPGIQPDRLRHTVWWIIDRVIDAGITTWGDFAPGRNGDREILAIKLDLIHWLRDIADYFVEEIFAEEIRRGAFDRGSLERAIGKGLWHHLPVAERIAKESHWLERADAVEKPRIARASRAGRIYGFGAATSAILKGFGEGWAADLQVEADRLVGLASNCTRHDYFAKAARGEGLNKDSGWFAELAEKGYIDGDLLLKDAEEVDKDHELNLPSAKREKELYDEWLRDMEDQLEFILGPRFPGPPGG